MSIGVDLTEEDLQAIQKLYRVRWTAEIKNWKERDTDFCLWLVNCPNEHNEIMTETGHSLAEVIDAILQRVF